VVLNHKAVARLMRESGLRARTLLVFGGPRQRSRRPDFPQSHPRLPPHRPLSALVGDITYMRIVVRFVYSAVILDV